VSFAAGLLVSSSNNAETAVNTPLSSWCAIGNFTKATSAAWPRGEFSRIARAFEMTRPAHRDGASTKEAPLRIQDEDR